jgi:hypothetical protein
MYGHFQTLLANYLTCEDMEMKYIAVLYSLCSAVTPSKYNFRLPALQKKVSSSSQNNHNKSSSLCWKTLPNVYRLFTADQFSRSPSLVRGRIVEERQGTPLPRRSPGPGEMISVEKRLRQLLVLF